MKVPNGFSWVECENDRKRKYDSLSDFGGPISKK